MSKVYFVGILLLIAFLALIIGEIIRKYTKEEIKLGGKYIKIFTAVLIIASILASSYYLLSPLVLGIVAGFMFYFKKESFYFGFVLAMSYGLEELIVANSSLFAMFNISDSSLGRSKVKNIIFGILGVLAGFLWKSFYRA